MNELDYKDITLTCVDCGKEFVWTATEQAFFHSKDLSQPKRCRECRLQRRKNTVTETQLKQLKGVSDGDKS